MWNDGAMDKKVTLLFCFMILMFLIVKPSKSCRALCSSSSVLITLKTFNEPFMSDFLSWLRARLILFLYIFSFKFLNLRYSKSSMSLGWLSVGFWSEKIIGFLRVQLQTLHGKINLTWHWAIFRVYGTYPEKKTFILLRTMTLNKVPLCYS